MKGRVRERRERDEETDHSSKQDLRNLSRDGGGSVGRWPSLTQQAGRLGSQGDDDPGDLGFLGIDGVTGCYR